MSDRKPIPGFDGYLASAGGDIYSTRGKGTRLLAAFRDASGYAKVKVRRQPGKPESVGVHRLVALAFLGPPKAGERFVVWNDGDRTNNAPSNLSWSKKQWRGHS